MSLFDWRKKSKSTVELPTVPDTAESLQQPVMGTAAPSGSKSARPVLYSVRVRKSFKGEILLQQAQLQLERQQFGGGVRKVTEGELIELMLEAFKVTRRNGEITGHAVPIADDVWYGLQQIARRLGSSPSEVFERMVVEKGEELGLFSTTSCE